MPSAAFKANYKLIDWSQPVAIRRKPQVTPARSSIAFPMVIRDHIAPTWNPVDGKHYESANGFKRAVKEAGKRAGKEYEIVGDDKAFAESKPREISTAPDLKRDIANAYKRVTGA